MPYRRMQLMAAMQRWRRFAFGAVALLFILWGTAAAVALFMVRFGLWATESGEVANLESGAPVHAVVYGATLDAATWPDAIGPDSALRVAQRLPGIWDLTIEPGHSPEAVRHHVQMCWNPNDSRGAWVVELRWPDCSCPADAVARWKVLIAIVDPLTGQPIDARLFTSVTRKEPLAVRFGEMPEHKGHEGRTSLPIIIQGAREGGDANPTVPAPGNR